MATLIRSTIVKAPVEKIFAYLNEPASMLEIWPGMEQATDVEHLPNGGVKFRWVTRFAGVRLEGISEDIEIVPNVKQVSKTTGGVDAFVTWKYEPVPEGTRVTMENEYVIPVPLLGKLAESVVAKMNEKDVETILANVKKRMES